ncbi:hypothetical protein HDU78_001262 [Chytriomyces hyalinus]|nr:hypothetical protein HDU78_001262 [Chytriomyces hyalinus]
MQLRHLLVLATCALSVAAAETKMKCKPKATPAVTSSQAQPPAPVSVTTAPVYAPPPPPIYQAPAPASSKSDIPTTTTSEVPAATTTSAAESTTTEDLPAPAPQSEVTDSQAATTTDAPQTDAPAPEPQPQPSDAPSPEPQPSDAPAPEPQPLPETTPAATTTDAPVSVEVPAPTTTVQPAPSPAPQEPAPAPKCSAENLPACALLVPFDNPPIALKTADTITQCVGLANYARHLYNPGAPDLIWSEPLAKRAKASADYAAKLDCWDCHSDSGPGTDWGQNLYLSKGSCWDSYVGWVTDEALAPSEANPDQGHFKNVVGIAIAFSPYLSIGCGSSTIGSSATVCNYGVSATYKS